MSGSGGGPHREEARPFPAMSSPPVSSVSSPTSLESFDDVQSMDMSVSDQSKPYSPRLVHPADNIFNWGPPAAQPVSGDNDSSGSDTSGPVRLTNLTPISPSNEDVHSSEQYKQPHPAIFRPGMPGKSDL